MEKHRKQTSPAQAGLEPTGGGGCQNQTKRVRKKATVPRGPPTKCESNDGERRKRKNGHGGFQRGGGGTERFVVFGKNEVGIVSGFVRQSRKVRRRTEVERRKKKKRRRRKKMKKDERRRKKTLFIGLLSSLFSLSLSLFLSLCGKQQRLNILFPSSSPPLPLLFPSSSPPFQAPPSTPQTT